MHEVAIDPIALDRLTSLVTPERARRLVDQAARARTLLDGRTVWNLNATATGGGVAEMLQSLLAYCRGAQVDARWLVLDADAEFFAITKRLHNLLHGSPGDGGDLGEAEQRHYRDVLAANLAELRSLVRPGDIVLAHDPQTVGLMAGLQQLGAEVVWRCHIGRDTPTELTERGWSFLRRHIEAADGFIFSRRVYAPGWLPQDKVWVIPPSLDPFSAKNAPLTPHEVRAALRQAGLVATEADHGSLGFTRRDGSRGEVRRHRGLGLDGGEIPAEARLVLQVSRWDRLKDMTGVLTGFADHLDLMPPDVHLVLAGPEVSGVSDDPEGAEVLEETLVAWRQLAGPVRDRVHLVCLPMDDGDENAHLVNALQRYASVVVQKSLVEGFGLTVTEPMWKARPVVASAVGGIQDQIVDEVNGLLLHDPGDLEAFATAVARVVADDDLGERLGAAAAERVRDEFLGDRHLGQYVDLFERLLTPRENS
jgi:trehalose synthase